jgi:hypothetical protein
VREVNREHGSLGAGRGPASLEDDHAARDTNHTMDIMRVLVLWLRRSWGLGAVRMVAAPNPPPPVPSVCKPVGRGADCSTPLALTGCSYLRIQGETKVRGDKMAHVEDCSGR